jgi:hypothetical protein
MPEPQKRFDGNPSGHIFMDNAMSGAFKQTEQRINKINRQREAGELNHRPERNPLRAQATPRQDWKIGFEFAPPPAKPVPERWVIPESDWGLMSKFSSQKGIYDAIYRKQANYDNEVAKFQATKAQNEQKIEAEWLEEKKKKEHNKKWTSLTVDDPDAVDIEVIDRRGADSSRAPDDDLRALASYIEEQQHTSRSVRDRAEQKKKQKQVRCCCSCCGSAPIEDVQCSMP